MKNGENFNSTPNTSKSFEDAYGSWDSLRDELEQKQQAKSEAEEAKRREEALKQGAKRFDKSVRDAVHKGDKVAFDEMMERDEHYRQMENGENQIESEEPYEPSTLSQEEMTEAANASSEIRKMDLLAKKIQTAESEEAKAKYRQQLIDASNEFSKNGVNYDNLKNKAEDRFIYKFSKKPEYRQKVLDTIWENAMAEPENKADDAKLFGADPAPENLIGLNGKELNKSEPKNFDVQPASDELVGLNGEKLAKTKKMVKLSAEADKFYKMYLEGASADELARYRGEVRSGLIQKGELTPEKEAMLDAMQRVHLRVGEQERKNKSAEEDVSIEEKAGRFNKIRSYLGKKIMKWGALGMLGMTIFGVGRQAAENFKETDNSPQTEQTFAGSAHADDAFTNGANFNSDGSIIESENNFNNGKYDSENDDYNKVDQKENKYSIGTNVAELSNEEFQKKMIESHSEDDIEYMGQFFVNDYESAQNLLGISNTEVDALVDAARSGDQTAFQKLNDAYSKYMEGAKVVGNQTLDGDYYSIFVNSNKDYAHSEGAFGGTARIVELGNGQQIMIRDQCKQLVMKKVAEIPNTWNTPVIPFEKTYTPPASVTEDPNKPVTPDNENPKDPETPTNEDPNKPVTPDSEKPKDPETPGNEDPNKPKTPPQTPKIDINYNKKYVGDQLIYNIDNAVTQMGAGELIGEASQEERDNNIDTSVAPGYATTEVKANGINESIDTSKIAEQPKQFEGEYTEEARIRDEEQARGNQVEAEAKAREAEQAKVETVNVGGETVSVDEILAAQQAYNNSIANGGAETNNTQQ